MQKVVRLEDGEKPCESSQPLRIQSYEIKETYNISEMGNIKCASVLLDTDDPERSGFCG